MNLLNKPELLDQLAAAHALGTLRGAARRRFEALAREQAPVRAAALVWQSRVASMNELQAPQKPAPEVWTRIENLVRAEQAQQVMATARQEPLPSLGGWLRSLTFWRAASAAGALATLLVVVHGISLRSELGAQVDALQARLQATPEVRYVAVLNDDKASAAMLVTFDPRNGRLNLQRVGSFKEAEDKSLQLWALPPGATPRSLGVLGPQRVLQLTAGEADVREVPVLAISLEPLGGVSGERGPTGPVLFKGPLIQSML
ncbi:anti-sigma factor [Hydrogenophaga sp.]|uniref:anti-sigma factor n=1 Tax=Hydrogenophaga sp. TaxID=1904254 RepID=UPI0026092F17|nr:anti-sigma factor [Hydrogenophaga sp.]MCW5654313.1 anti-sigma factor [Hydrogenophaga sp.]